MKQPNERLLPCNFCGHAQPLAIRPNTWWVVECQNDMCRAKGPERGSIEDAIRAWNTRVPAVHEGMVEAVAGSSISLDPLPQDVYFRLDEREKYLQGIGDCVAYWLRWITKEREVEGLETDKNMHIMLEGENTPPHWPTVGQLTRWLQIIRAPAIALAAMTPRPRSKP